MCAVVKAVFHQLDLLKLKHNNLSLYLGLSGGLDSVVLLHVLAKYCAINPKVNLTAVYIDHNLQPDSKSWVDFNRELCTRYNIVYQSYSVKVDINSSLGLEAEARTARYGVFEKLINSKDSILLTAHHLNDQAETFLLQLMRASGPRGLSAMPIVKKFSVGFLIRPLLEIKKQELSQYAFDNNLTWVEDKTNLDIKQDRNFIRNKVIPLIENRWSNFASRAAKSARFCAEHEKVLNSYLDYDLKKCKLDFRILDLTLFINYDKQKQKLLLRHWLDEVSIKDFGVSYSLGDKILKEIINNCICAKNDANTQIQIEKYILKKFQNKLYLLGKEGSAELNKSTDGEYEYIVGTDLNIESLGVRITSKFIDSNCDKVKLKFSKETKLCIKFRKNGERCRPSGRGGSVSVKKLLQEHNIPPWQRHLIPILYVGEDIASVIGVRNCEPYASKESGWVVECQYINNQENKENIGRL